MSTKCTINHGPNNYWGKKVPEGIDWHCYYESLEDDDIYLEIVNPRFAEVKYSEYHKGTVATIAIPGKLWNCLVRMGELKSWSGEDFDHPRTQEERNKETEDGILQTIEMLEGMINEKKQKRNDFGQKNPFGY